MLLVSFYILGTQRLSLKILQILLKKPIYTSSEKIRYFQFEIGTKNERNLYKTEILILVLCDLVPSIWYLYFGTFWLKFELPHLIGPNLNLVLGHFWPQILITTYFFWKVHFRSKANISRTFTDLANILNGLGCSRTTWSEVQLFRNMKRSHDYNYHVFTKFSLVQIRNRIVSVTWRIIFKPQSHFWRFGSFWQS